MVDLDYSAWPAKEEEGHSCPFSFALIYDPAGPLAQLHQNLAFRQGVRGLPRHALTAHEA
jgi:hypothetical protein